MRRRVDFFPWAVGLSVQWFAQQASGGGVWGARGGVIMARIIQWIIDWIFGRKIGRIIDRIIEWIIRKCDRGLTFGLPPDPEEINYPF